MQTPDLTLYGIPTCDTVRRARAWLAAQAVPARFHDWRRDGVSAALLMAWTQQLDWTRLLNRQGTTWRGLPAAEQAAVVDAASAVALLVRHPAAIRRPVVQWPDGSLSVGFGEADWARRMKAP